MADWLGYIISFVGGTIIPSIGWIYTYRKDRKERKEKLATENSAFISANIVKHPKGTRTLKVFNFGKAEARNVRMIPVPESSFENLAIRPDYSKAHYDIAPQSNREFTIHLWNGSPDEITLLFFWDDNNGSSKEKKITLQLR